MMINVNLFAVLVAAVLNMLIGFVWYHPKVLGTQWMKLSGVTAKDIEAGKSQMGKTYGMMMVAALVMAFVLGKFIQMAGATTIASGAMIGFWAWVGFVATVMLNTVMFEGRALKLYYLNVGYYFVAFLVMGAVLARMGV